MNEAKYKSIWIQLWLNQAINIFIRRIIPTASLPQHTELEPDQLLIDFSISVSLGCISMAPYF